MNLLDELSMELAVGRGDLEKIVRTAPARYRVFQIEKRSGGTRTIAQPSASLKQIQRYVLTKKLRFLPVHHAAAAYAKGMGIAQNAERHAVHRYILKLDFRSFFPSIGVRDWRRVARRARGTFPLDDMPTYDKILFWGVGTTNPVVLSIGAPSSPYLSNAVMFDFDVAVQAVADKRGLTYTRYADDITISGDDRKKLLLVERYIEAIVRKSKSPLLTLNDEKRGLYGPGERRIVTGLIITPSKAVSLGRDRKRLISSMIFRSMNGQLDIRDISHLRGLLAFCNDVEPSFVRSMRTKYGGEVVDKILSSKQLLSA